MAQKILIIDSDDANRAAVGQTLASNNFIVVESKDGNSGLATIKATPDLALVLVAIAIPKPDGAELLRTIKSDSSYINLPFIIMCEESDEPTFISQLQEDGASGWLVKPIGGEELLLLINRVLSAAA